MRLERDNIPLDKEFPFQISEVELTPENSRPGSYHWHSYFEITCVLGGKGNYFVNGQEYTMEEDDIIIFNNVEPHGWKLIGGDMKLLVMIFSPEFVAEKLSIFDTEYLKPFVERGSNFKNRIGRGRRGKRRDPFQYLGDLSRMAAEKRRLSADDQGECTSHPYHADPGLSG